MLAEIVFGSQAFKLLFVGKQMPLNFLHETAKTDMETESLTAFLVICGIQFFGVEH